MREGGLHVPVIMRFSAIPGHSEPLSVSCLRARADARLAVSTAVFATCGMSVWRFLISATIGLPKQLAAVYLGDNQGGTGCRSLAAAEGSRLRAIIS